MPQHQGTSIYQIFRRQRLILQSSSEHYKVSTVILGPTLQNLRNKSVNRSSPWKIGAFQIQRFDLKQLPTHSSLTKNTLKPFHDFPNGDQQKAETHNP
jgi:hypothetical protein